MPNQVGAKHQVKRVETVVIRFVGDSGDGMQLTGSEFTKASALAGNDLATFSDYPAEIRAPAGSLAGVSGYQVHFGAREIFTPGDAPDVLVAMNPAALKTNLPDLRQGGMILVNSGAFTPGNLEKAGYRSNPLDDEALQQNFRVFPVDMHRLTETALEGSGLSAKDVARCKNYFALGLMYWLYSRPTEGQLQSIAKKFAKKPLMAEANAKVFKAGYAFGETSEVFFQRYQVPASRLAKGTYRNVTGNYATALGLATAAFLSKRQLFLGLPITPASEILHELALMKDKGVVTFQAEDEIAGIGSAIGAAFGGALGVTTTSGPGLALKSEMLGFAVITELPLVLVNVQRGGPSTGMPTKTEQADLLISLFGRHGEAPLPVIAAQSPSDCFWAALEAMRVAVRWMTPVILLTDGYLANGTEPFRIPTQEELPSFSVNFAKEPNSPDGTFMPYQRDERLVRAWAIPGTPGLEHRVGGLEKDSLSGMVSYDGANHEKMVRTRAQKIRNVVADVPDVEVFGGDHSELLLVSWGGTFGSVRGATEQLRAQGRSVGHVHLRWLNPLPKNLGAVLQKAKRVLVPEVNEGQLAFYLRGIYAGVDPVQFNRVNGRPIKISELVAKVLELHRGGEGVSIPDSATKAPTYSRKDFESGIDPRWCPGCGDYSIINQVQKTMPNVGVRRENMVFISGIGCSSRFPYYMNNYGMHTLHGRAPTFATGLKISRPELMVWVVTGDGDALAIGGNHFIHAMRRNLDLKILLFNNRIYGLTKGQASPTSELLKKTKSTPYGTPDAPFNPPALALGAGATFVARALDVEGAHMGGIIKAAAEHKGSAFVEIYQNCPVFNDGAYLSITDKSVKANELLRMEHGKPLLFGKNSEKGIRFDGRQAKLEVVTIGEKGAKESDILVHDVAREDPTLAFMLANLSLQPGFPTPIGVLRDVRRPTADEITWEQVNRAKEKAGPPTLERLLCSGDTWTIP